MKLFFFEEPRRREFKTILFFNKRKIKALLVIFKMRFCFSGNKLAALYFNLCHSIPIMLTSGLGWLDHKPRCEIQEEVSTFLF